MTGRDACPLAEQMASISSKSEFGYVLRDFLDRFQENPNPALLEAEPGLLDARLGDEGVADAYLAAVAAWLCHRHGHAAPLWARDDRRLLTKPYFAASSHGLRMILLQESPPEFRVRNIFVSANALERA